MLHHSNPGPAPIVRCHRVADALEVTLGPRVIGHIGHGAHGDVLAVGAGPRPLRCLDEREAIERLAAHARARP